MTYLFLQETDDGEKDAEEQEVDRVATPHRCLSACQRAEQDAWNKALQPSSG